MIGDSQYFLIFSKIFSIHEDVAPEGVMIRLRAADESSLSDDAVKLIIKTVIRLAHLHESIFHLLIKKISNSLIRDKKIGVYSYFHFLIVQTTTPQTSKLSSSSILMGLKLRLAGLNSI